MSRQNRPSGSRRHAPAGFGATAAGAVVVVDVVLVVGSVVVVAGGFVETSVVVCGAAVDAGASVGVDQAGSQPALGSLRGLLVPGHGSSNPRLVVRTDGSAPLTPRSFASPS